MEDRFTDDIHWLTSDTLRGEWASLNSDLARIGMVQEAHADLRPEGHAQLYLAVSDDHIAEIDRRVMACLAMDPEHRRTLPGGTVELALRFRRWWRASVPFLMDPDGDRHVYVFERVEVNGPSAEPGT